MSSPEPSVEKMVVKERSHLTESLNSQRVSSYSEYAFKYWGEPFTKCTHVTLVIDWH
jgi:hypothetical protein